MSHFSLKHLSQQLFPFLILGISIAIFVAVCIMLSYVLVWGLLIGLFLWAVTKIKSYFHKRQIPTATDKKGRVIEHKD